MQGTAELVHSKIDPAVSAADIASTLRVPITDYESSFRACQTNILRTSWRVARGVDSVIPRRNVRLRAPTRNTTGRPSAEANRFVSVSLVHSRLACHGHPRSNPTWPDASVPSTETRGAPVGDNEAHANTDTEFRRHLLDLSGVNPVQQKTHGSRRSWTNHSSSR